MVSFLRETETRLRFAAVLSQAIESIAREGNLRLINFGQNLQEQKERGEGMVTKCFDRKDAKDAN